MDIKRKQIKDICGHLRNTTIWEIEVDYTNLLELESLATRIKSQIGSIRTTISGSKKEIKQSKFDACQGIYNTDISDVYATVSLDASPIYYVYAHCEPGKIAIGKEGLTTWAATLGLTNIPFYIGKGTADRAFNLNRNETHRKVKQKLAAFGQEICVNIIKEGLTELEALCLESKLIDIFGVVGKGGRLVNLDEGVNSAVRQARYAVHLQEINKFYKNSLKVEA